MRELVAHGRRNRVEGRQCVDVALHREREVHACYISIGHELREQCDRLGLRIDGALERGVLLRNRLHLVDATHGVSRKASSFVDMCLHVIADIRPGDVEFGRKIVA